MCIYDLFMFIRTSKSGKLRPQKPSHHCHHSKVLIWRALSGWMRNAIWRYALRMSLVISVGRMFGMSISNDWTQRGSITLFANMHLLLVQKASHLASRRSSLLASPSNMEISQHEIIQWCHAMTCGFNYEPCRVLPTCIKIVRCIMVYYITVLYCIMFSMLAV